MIKTFKDARTERIWNGQRVKIPADIQRKALLKLRYIYVAKAVDDLRLPPGNRLEKLSGDRKGQHSIRVNKQYRICFKWTQTGAEDVEFTDYH